MNAVLIPHRRKLTGTITNDAGAGNVLQFPTGVGGLESKTVLIHQFIQDFTGGSAATHRPRIGATGFVNDSINEKYAAAAAVAVATPINEKNMLVHLTLDSDARAHLKPGGDVGADNDYVYELWYEEVKLDA